MVQCVLISQHRNIRLLQTHLGSSYSLCTVKLLTQSLPVPENPLTVSNPTESHSLSPSIRYLDLFSIYPLYCEAETCLALTLGQVLGFNRLSGADWQPVEAISQVRQKKVIGWVE